MLLLLCLPRCILCSLLGFSKPGSWTQEHTFEGSVLKAVTDSCTGVIDPNKVSEIQKAQQGCAQFLVSQFLCQNGLREGLCDRSAEPRDPRGVRRLPFLKTRCSTGSKDIVHTHNAKPYRYLFSTDNFNQKLKGRRLSKGHTSYHGRCPPWFRMRTRSSGNAFNVLIL